MKSRSMFAKLVLLSLMGVACAMLSLAFVEESASALVKRPDPAKMLKNEAMYGTNRKVAVIPVAALADGADLTASIVFVCPYDLVVDQVKFLATTTPTTQDGGTVLAVTTVADGGLGAATTVAQSTWTAASNYPAINQYKIVPATTSARSCLAGSTMKLAITNTGSVVDTPAGFIQIDYHLQDVFAYTPDGGAI